MSSLQAVNYADLVLQEAAAAAEAAKAADKTASEVTSAIVELNLKDEEMFPSLGQNVKKAAPTWGNASNAAVKAPPPSLLQAASMSSTATSSKPAANSIISCPFQLPADQQRRSIASISLPETLERVMQETDTVVEASTSAQTKAISFVIRGKPAQVSLAKRRIWSALAQNGSIEFEVPQDALRFIIGPGGRTLQSIQHDLAVKVQIPKAEHWQGSIKVIGDFEGVALARDRILDIAAERSGKEAVQIEMDAAVARFLWMSSVSGLDEAAVKAEFPDVKLSLHRVFFAAASTPASHLSISGSREQVAAVKEMCNEAIERLKRTLKCVTTPIPKPLHRMICGPKMSNLLALEAQSSCAIDLPPLSEADSDAVSVTAPEQFLAHGLAAVMNFTKGVDHRQIALPSEGILLLFSSSGKWRSELKAIEKETGATVLLTAEQKSICIEGKREAVSEAAEMLDRLLTDATVRFPSFEHMAVDQSHVKHIIGRKGNVIQQIQKDFSVEIVLDDDEGDVCLWGTLESIAEAKAYISKLLSSITDLVTLTAKIDHKFHAMLIGAKGANLAAYQERFPSVVVSFPQDPTSDVVEFRGLRDEAEAFRSDLVAQAEAIRHEQIMNGYIQSIPKLPIRSNKDRIHLQNFARMHGVKLIFEDESDNPSQGCHVQGNKRAVDTAAPLIEAEAALLADRDTLRFSVDARHHPVLIGKGGKNLKHLNSKYGVNVRFPDDGNRDEVTIIGPKANLPKARDELLDLLKYHLETSNQESLAIPAALLGKVAGRGWSRITGIEVSTNCRISTKKLPENPEIVEFIISGSIEGIQAAKAEIQSIVNEQAKIKEVSVSCPAELLSAYRFAFRTVTAAHEACKFFPHPSENRVNIRGEAEAVDAAQKALEAVLVELPSYKTVSVPEIGQEAFGKLLGPGGENVKRLTAKHGVEVRVPRIGQTGEVQVAGPAEGVDAAIQEISAIMSRK